jgi:hypothetical protein
MESFQSTLFQHIIILLNSLSVPYSFTPPVPAPSLADRTAQEAFVYVKAVRNSWSRAARRKRNNNTSTMIEEEAKEGEAMECRISIILPSIHHQQHNDREKERRGEQEEDQMELSMEMDNGGHQDGEIKTLEVEREVETEVAAERVAKIKFEWTRGSQRILFESFVSHLISSLPTSSSTSSTMTQ